VVFNTAMTSIIVETLPILPTPNKSLPLTYLHIGSTGTNPGDAESNRVCWFGDSRFKPLVTSNWREHPVAGRHLKEHGVVAIAGIDTVASTRILREKGAQNGRILVHEMLPNISYSWREARHQGHGLGQEVSSAEHTSGAQVYATNSHVEIPAMSRPTM
jgi:carbamoyl-phosphate synthase small subunit